MNHNKNTPEVPFSLKKMIQGMPEHAYVFSKEGKLLAWNKNIETITGYSNDELKNKFVSEFIYTADKERVVKKFMELLAEGEDNEPFIEYHIQQKSGKAIPIVAMRSLVIVDGNSYIIGILINTTNLKNNKEKLKAQIAKMNHLKSQLKDHYLNIEKMNQVKIELKKRLFINAKTFSNKLINSLPGIFYLYEKTDDKFYLKRWNNNLESNIGYSAEELFNMQPYQFFTKAEFVRVGKAIMQIFKTGETQIHSHIITKKGNQIPYFYDAYKFENEGNLYFMGVGLDISQQYKLERDLNKSNIEKKQEKQEKIKAYKIIEAKKRELVTTALQIGKTSKIIKSTIYRIDELIVKNQDTGICNDLNHIRKNLETQSKKQDNWEVFKLHFTEIHKDFFNNLKEKHPSLTKTELKFSAYLRIQLSSYQISSVLNVTNEAIKKTRYRIRKKLGLSTKDSLEDYISKF